MSELKTMAENYIEKARQMITYREGQLDKPEKQKVRSLIAHEIDVLEFLIKHTEDDLKAQGIYL